MKIILYNAEYILCFDAQADHSLVETSIPFSERTLIYFSTTQHNTMMRMIKALASSLLFATAALAADIRSNSIAGQLLLKNARSLNNNNNNNNGNADLSFIAEYSIKFQGCHHVQQWNDNVDATSDVRIMTKRLVRFRLCPIDQCSNDRSAGCSSKYGDYVVDMDTFVDAYLTATENDKDTICADAETECTAACYGSSDETSCMNTCYSAIDMSQCSSEYTNNGFVAQDYAYCKEFQMGRRRQLANQASNYYIGTFCADQGGQIHLGLFTDDTCTSFASNGYSTFKTAMGYSIPYSETSLVSTRCLSCGQSNGYGGYQSKGTCETPYKMAGKCETKMSIDYPNESSCNYIEGIKIIRQDGVIRTSAVKKSKAAAVGIGLFTTMSVLLAAYVYYLRTKLIRAQINLAAASHSLT